jgi:hypothetical protein
MAALPESKTTASGCRNISAIAIDDIKNIRFTNQSTESI